ncbi:MAG: hypothetical protein GWO08_22645, partial [Gammaproteobacteria bacterium]|nr:hypothetical protein [Gammaproteobacteria bacterium]NIR68251.1 hypothetical protein [candidate division Zixibacteria bacterium]NIR96329.1 hypothetical protein [Gammaproteobacteria bacterium]NIS49421.1 hypothetical protein [candidate division Zixibacteria bacterium]NIT51959.1 hypothetical protein [candidate division Zixibacteria bacterium]
GYPVLVSQNMRLFTASVLENILNDLPEKKDLSHKQKRDLAKRLLIQAGLKDLVRCLEKPAVDLPIPVQRHLAIARAAVSKPGLLCVDEPTTDLSHNDSNRILNYLKKLGENSAVMVVLHNQQQARNFSDNTALLAGGWIQDCNTTEKFFKQPANEITKSFLIWGSCLLPSADANPEELDDSIDLPVPPPLPESAKKYVSDSFGPRGFLWLKKGLLAGTPRPGIVADEGHDLRALKRVGIKVLVSLTEKPFSKEKLKKYDIEGKWLAIKDMKAPKYEEALNLCREIQLCMVENKPVAYHCKAGLGRTGTLLAAQLVLEGMSALEALEAVRKIEPRWVQSDVQVKFIEGFASYLENSSLSEAGGI